MCQSSKMLILQLSFFFVVQKENQAEALCFKAPLSSPADAASNQINLIPSPTFSTVLVHVITIPSLNPLSSPLLYILPLFSIGATLPRYFSTYPKAKLYHQSQQRPFLNAYAVVALRSQPLWSSQVKWQLSVLQSS